MVQLPNGMPRQVTAAAGCFSHPDHATVPAQLRTAVRTHSQPTAARVGTELHSHDFKRFSVSTHTMRRPLHHVNPPPPTAQPRRHLQSATKSLRMRGGEASQEYLHVARERGQHSGCNACGHRITFVSKHVSVSTHHEAAVAPCSGRGDKFAFGHTSTSCGGRLVTATVACHSLAVPAVACRQCQ